MNYSKFEIIDDLLEEETEEEYFTNAILEEGLITLPILFETYNRKFQDTEMTFYYLNKLLQGKWNDALCIHVMNKTNLYQSEENLNKDLELIKEITK